MIHFESFIFSIIGAIICISFISFGIIIMKSDSIYDKEKARWKSGINIPGLDAEKGDIVDHDAFKSYVGYVFICFGTMIFTLLILLGFYYDRFHEVSHFYGAIYFVISLFIILLFSNYKEKYIKRINSVEPKHHKYLMMGILMLFTTIYIIILIF